MKTLIGALLVLALGQPAAGLAGPYGASGAVVGGGYYGPRDRLLWSARRLLRPRMATLWRSCGGCVFRCAPGLGVGTPAYYPPPLLYPSVVTVPPPVVYVEKGEANVPPVYGSGESLEAGYWYYCRERHAFYPAVTQCPSRWEKVAPVEQPVDRSSKKGSRYRSA